VLNVDCKKVLRNWQRAHGITDACTTRSWHAVPSEPMRDTILSLLALLALIRPANAEPPATALPEPKNLADAFRAYDDMGVVRWAAHHLRWRDVDGSETTLKRAEKDRRAERGKRLCASARISDIRRASSTTWAVDVGQIPDVARLWAVGSSGNLERGSTATFCAAVLSVEDSRVQLLGMFALKENGALH